MSHSILELTIFVYIEIFLSQGQFYCIFLATVTQIMSSYSKHYKNPCGDHETVTFWGTKKFALTRALQQVEEFQGEIEMITRLIKA